MSERNACAQNVTLSTFFSQYPREPNTIIQSKKPYQRRGLHEPKINKNTQKCGGGGKHYLLVAGATSLLKNTIIQSKEIYQRGYDK